MPHLYSENLVLGSWVMNLRTLYRTLRNTTPSGEVIRTDNYLTSERMKKLDSIGFVWSGLRQTWEERFADLVKYKEENGVRFSVLCLCIFLFLLLLLNESKSVVFSHLASAYFSLILESVGYLTFASSIRRSWCSLPSQ